MNLMKRMLQLRRRRPGGETLDEAMSETLRGIFEGGRVEIMDEEGLVLATIPLGPLSDVSKGADPKVERYAPSAGRAVVQGKIAQARLVDASGEYQMSGPAGVPINLNDYLYRDEEGALRVDWKSVPPEPWLILDTDDLRKGQDVCLYQISFTVPESIPGGKP